MSELSNYMLNNENVDISFSQDNQSLSSLLGTESSPIVVEIKGEELEDISYLTTEVKDKMNSLSGLSGIISSVEDGAPEVNIDIDRTFCGINDITVSSIVEQISQKLSGVEIGQMD